MARAREISNCASGRAMSRRVAATAREATLVCRAPAGSSVSTCASLAGMCGAAATAWTCTRAAMIATALGYRLDACIASS